LIKFLAVGCGLNEVSPKANIESSILADLMAVYLKPHTSSLLPRLRRPMSRTQEAEAQEDVPSARDVPEPTSRPQIPRGGVPTPTANHARRALRRPNRILHRLDRFGWILSIPILTPLPDVP